MKCQHPGCGNLLQDDSWFDGYHRHEELSCITCGRKHTRAGELIVKGPQNGKKPETQPIKRSPVEASDGTSPGDGAPEEKDPPDPDPAPEGHDLISSNSPILSRREVKHMKETIQDSKVNIQNEGKRKTCKKCGKMFPADLGFFGKQSNNNDGMDGSCRACRKKTVLAGMGNKGGKKKGRNYQQEYTTRVIREEINQAPLSANNGMNPGSTLPEGSFTLPKPMIAALKSLYDQVMVQARKDILKEVEALCAAK